VDVTVCGRLFYRALLQKRPEICVDVTVCGHRPDGLDTFDTDLMDSTHLEEARGL